MQDFDKFSFDGPLGAGERRAFDVYVKGQGNPVLLMQVTEEIRGFRRRHPLQNAVGHFHQCDRNTALGSDSRRL